MALELKEKAELEPEELVDAIKSITLKLNKSELLKLYNLSLTLEGK